MLRITNKINDELIDIREFAKPNACFQTNEYPDNYDFCILHEQFNPYDLFNDNKIKDKEIKRLNNIIEKLEKYLDEQMSKNVYEDEYMTCFNDKGTAYFNCFDKLKELKGGKL